MKGLEAQYAIQVAIVKLQLSAAIVRLKSSNSNVKMDDRANFLDQHEAGRREIDGKGGYTWPSCRSWHVGQLDEADLYLFEVIDWGLWKGNTRTHSLSMFDTGRYQLALSDKRVAMHVPEGVFIRSISEEDLTDEYWSLEQLVQIADLLKGFCVQVAA